MAKSSADAPGESGRSPLARVRAAKAERADERLLTGPKLILFGIHVSLVGGVVPELWPLVVVGLAISVVGLTR
ncbi:MULTISPECIES: hypothetical protein [Halobacteriales]|uniref:hypothetical protein n=1 Tax=Halobacteriales TaxID=2235 RepID=UPI002B1E393F|nr:MULTISPECIES: hypothetical protein [Halobacteriales]